MRMRVDFDYNLNRLRAELVCVPVSPGFHGRRQGLIYRPWKPNIHHAVTIARMHGGLRGEQAEGRRQSPFP